MIVPRRAKEGTLGELAALALKVVNLRGPGTVNPSGTGRGDARHGAGAPPGPLPSGEGSSGAFSRRLGPPWLPGGPGRHRPRLG